MALHDPKRGGGIGGGQDDVALRFESPPAERQDRRFVFDDQHRFAAARGPAFLGTHRRVGGCRDSRQIDLEARAPPRLRIDGDVTAALFHDAVHRSEPEPRTLADFLGGKERLEQMGADAGFHARASIGDGEHRVGSRNRAEMRLRERLVQVDVGRFDGQLPAVGHCVACVHREVHDHLLDLIRIRADASQIVCGHRHERDMLADEAPQHLVHLGHDDVEVEHFGLQHLAPAVRQQLTGQRRRPFRCFADLLDVAALGIAGRQIAQQELRIS